MHFDATKKLKLECDAWLLGVGTVLFHSSNSAHIPIGFRTGTPAERNYSQLKREALALILGVTKFWGYLLGREFTLATDHQPFLYLLRPECQIPTMAAVRIVR